MSGLSRTSARHRPKKSARRAIRTVKRYFSRFPEAINWNAWLEEQQKRAGSRSLDLLDVACGSGKFPAALTAYGNLEAASLQPVQYSLLDPSAFSISEAKRALQPPFTANQEFEKTLQELDCPAEAFDIVWATHALYAIPFKELRLGLERFIDAIKKETGKGFIAHANHNAHYLIFYRHYLAGFRASQGEPYPSAEQIIALLDDMKASLQVHDITYSNGTSDTERHHVEGYLQRCIFDNTISLNDMLANPETGPYLRTCLRNDIWNFQQNVSLIFISA